MNGIILKALSGFYYVGCGSEIYECKARGSFRKNGISPLVGDFVEFEITENMHGIIERVCERKTCLYRPPVANIEKLFIISSFATPSPNSYIVDRLTAIAVYNGIKPYIVFNKCDMGDFEDWQRIYCNAGFETFVVSAATGEGTEELRTALKNSVCAFTGNSGVGKSSLINRLFGSQIETGDVSEKLGRGRHTTRHTELFINPDGGYVADTPGFSSIEYDSGDYGFKEQLAECFPDFERFTGSCRFSTCSHTCENGCGVLKAVEDGLVEPTRHRSYVELFNELKQLKPWEAHNRKKK